jgi:hypothetical protein
MWPSSEEASERTLKMDTVHKSSAAPSERNRLLSIAWGSASLHPRLWAFRAFGAPPCPKPSHGAGDYEVDHLISLELGGSNSIKNLWPESHRTSPWNAQVKDRLEDKLHELVCSGQLDLKTAQKAIASNWLEAYKKYVSPNPPSSRLASPSATEPPLNSDQVWVNTKSGKYWKLGSRYYGKTKQGLYMSEKEAVQKGYRPANGTGE